MVLFVGVYQLLWHSLFLISYSNVDLKYWGNQSLDQIFSHISCSFLDFYEGQKFPLCSWKIEYLISGNQLLVTLNAVLLSCNIHRDKARSALYRSAHWWVILIDAFLKEARGALRILHAIYWIHDLSWKGQDNADLTAWSSGIHTQLVL